jgi:glycogen debranching enzyme
MRDAGDPDGDGLIEYQSRSGRSLRNQGWKDSENAIQFADGELARGPIALVEVQGYAYRARRELASVLAWMGAEREADELDAEASTVRALVRERYWRPGTAGRPGYFTLALDGEKRPVDAVASNMGHLLWSEVPDRDQAAQVAAHLTGAELASGWGVRTLSSEMAGFNPISYHLGSVWPHDTVIACEGLRRYGLDAAALGLASNLLDALAAFDHRLPELFGGQPREPGDIPVPYPTACRPQAWAAGAALSLVPLLLGLEVDVPGGVVSLAPALPPGMSRLEVSGIPLPSGILSLAHDDGGTKLIDVPDGMSVRVRPRPVRPGSPPAP